VFFRSGLTKLRDWDATLALLMDEYHVPLLAPRLRTRLFGHAPPVGARYTAAGAGPRR
jgi:hypothetical protein